MRSHDKFMQTINADTVDDSRYTPSSRFEYGYDEIVFLEILFHHKFQSCIRMTSNWRFDELSFRSSPCILFFLVRRRDIEDLRSNSAQSLYPWYEKLILSSGEIWFQRRKRGTHAYTRAHAQLPRERRDEKRNARRLRSRCSWRSRRTSPKVLHSVYPADR